MKPTPAFYFDIQELLAKGKCPACELVRSKPLQYIDHALYGLVVDPHAQNLFADTGGYCRHHAEMLFKIPWGSALGVAILYNRLVEDAEAEFAGDGAETAAREKRRGSPLAKFIPAARKSAAPRPDNPNCLACKVERETEQGVLDTLVSTLTEADERMVKAVTEQDGFCFYHLELALEKNPGGEAGRLLRNHGLRIAKKLGADLKEFIRKSDYRNTGEQMGLEGDSWMRAVAWVTGISREK